MALPDAYIRHIKAEIERERGNLEALETGKLKLGSRTAERPEWVDITPDAIARCKMTIGTYEQILARHESSTNA